jgi:hypothetical protein
MRNRRQAPRYLFGVAAKLSRPGSTAVSEVIVVNIGRRGCCAEGAGVWEVGQKCLLSIVWRGAQIPTEAEVAWNDAQGRTGFKFLAVEGESRKLLNELCSTLHLQLATWPPPKGA